MPRMSRYSRMAMALGLLAACGDAQVGPRYRGEPLLKIQGSVTKMDGASLDRSIVPVIAWWQQRPIVAPSGVIPDASHDPSRWVLHDVGVQGEFPAEFTLSVYEPPPPGSRFTLAFERDAWLSYGYIVAVPADHPSETRGNILDPSGFVDIPIAEGVVQNYIVAYVPEDQPEGSIISGMLNGYRALARGMHVVSIRAVTDAEFQEQNECRGRAYAKFLQWCNETYGTSFVTLDDYYAATHENEELALVSDEQQVFVRAERCFLTLDAVAEVAESAASKPLELTLGREARALQFR
jgi:hypothetical protein